MMSGPLKSKQVTFSWKAIEAHEQKLSGAINAALAKGNEKDARRAQRRYLSSFSARLVAVRKAYRSLEYGKRPAYKDLAIIASNLSPFLGTDESVTVHLKQKAGGSIDPRIIMDFGFENRALQRLVFRALLPFVKLRGTQFATKGGVHAAIAAVCEAQEAGHCYGYEVDISSCYQSFNGEGLCSLLPLPKEVIRRVLLSKELSLTPGNLSLWEGGDDGGNGKSVAAYIAEARLGIPQGSSVSPLVADALLAWVIDAVPKKGVVITYADNFLLMAKTPEDACTMLSALWSALAAHPAGPLKPHSPIGFKPGLPLQFLGHCIDLVNGKCVVQPDEDNREAFDMKFGSLYKKLKAAGHSKIQRRKHAARLAKYINGWTNSYANWNGAGFHV